MLIGYARVSTTDQNLTLQKKALEKAKNNRISTIVATPHVVSGKHTLKDLEKENAELKEKVNSTEK